MYGVAWLWLLLFAVLKLSGTTYVTTPPPLLGSCSLWTTYLHTAIGLPLLFCFFDKNRATKATYWRRLLWLILQGIHSLSWGRQSSGQGRHGTGCSLASTLRKQRVNRGWGWHIVSQPAPSHPPIPARLHLLRVPQPSQTSTPTGAKCSNIWACEGHCTFKSKLTFVPHRLGAISWCKMYLVQFRKSSWSLIVSAPFKTPKSKVSSETWGYLSTWKDQIKARWNRVRSGAPCTCRTGLWDSWWNHFSSKWLR